MAAPQSAPQSVDTHVVVLFRNAPTVHNLVQSLSVKLDSAARYGLYQDDARNDGYEDCAEMLGRLAERERQDIADLLSCLRKHVGEGA